jgi:hypothetical protein
MTIPENTAKTKFLNFLIKKKKRKETFKISKVPQRGLIPNDSYCPKTSKRKNILLGAIT